MKSRVDEQDIIIPPPEAKFRRLNKLELFETVGNSSCRRWIRTGRSDVRVKEKPTGQFSIGGGFSTLDKVVAIADITEGNIGGMAGWDESAVSWDSSGN